MSVDAEKPFDSSAKADIILRSSDSVDFYAISLLLSTVSPIFDDMFSLNSTLAQQEITKNGLPVVLLEESNMILQHFLVLIYPHIHEPDLLNSNSSRDFIKICQAAQKYCMDIVEEKLKKMILASSFIKEEPFRVYLMAVRM
ncbi:hypothetical protein AMATHDRAFT_4157 [Amanita thiersii Skay4041]|uniref:BTB domain-containing protein n=1 Tax=Amanita thiersii Skay4041 TaxID=703135 RepID=A0A2A9NPJ8_9AGAR|nr:hypothetical protein AMATHDRAFT_4157 [Amanita thiersii Skay4041]